MKNHKRMKWIWARVMPLFIAATWAEGRSPNVLMICVDDLRPELGCYGDSRLHTPNIDRLAEAGVRFTNMHCNVPVCGASRASLMTGIRPNPQRFLDAASRASKDMPGAKTIPQVFREAGYHTLANGKVFHHADDTENESWSEKVWLPDVSHDAYFVEENNLLRHPRFNWGPWVESADQPEEAYFDGKVADKTIRDLERLAGGEEPFFVACGFYRPHLPFNAPARYFDLYPIEQLQPAGNRDRPLNAPASLRDSSEPGLYHLKGIEYNSDTYHLMSLQGYFACVSFIDAQVGKILDALERLGLAEETIVVLWGDHGWNLGEHNFWGKHNLLHNATRIPLIVKAPLAVAGGKAETMAEFVDLFPTLCELAGIEAAPAEADRGGRSLVPALRDPSVSIKDAVWVRFRNGDKLQTRRFAYTEWALPKGKESMLFDHEKDPAENRNVVDEPEYADTVEAIRKELLRRQVELGFLTNESK